MKRRHAFNPQAVEAKIGQIINEPEYGKYAAKRAKALEWMRENGKSIINESPEKSNDDSIENHNRER